jgi:hypothetical protein
MDIMLHMSSYEQDYFNTVLEIRVHIKCSSFHQSMELRNIQFVLSSLGFGDRLHD